jgi:hypothetical protein
MSGPKEGRKDDELNRDLSGQLPLTGNTQEKNIFFKAAVWRKRQS